MFVYYFFCNVVNYKYLLFNEYKQSTIYNEDYKMSDIESIKLPEGYKVANTWPEVHQMVIDFASQFTTQCTLPVSQEYPAHSQFPCVIKVYINDEYCVRIEYFPLALYKEVMEFKEASRSLVGVKDSSIKLVEGEKYKYTVVADKEALEVLMRRYRLKHNLDVSKCNPIDYPIRYPCVVNITHLKFDAMISFIIAAVHMDLSSNAFYGHPTEFARIKNAAPKATENGIQDINRSIPVIDTSEVVGYCILMHAAFNVINTKQFYGRGSIMSVVNRAFDCIAVFNATEKKYEWQIVSSIPLTEADLEEFANSSHHIADV